MFTAYFASSLVCARQQIYTYISNQFSTWATNFIYTRSQKVNRVQFRKNVVCLNFAVCNFFFSFFFLLFLFFLLCLHIVTALSLVVDLYSFSCFPSTRASRCFT